MEIPVVDLDRLREALPKHAKVILRKKKTEKGKVALLECIVPHPSLSKKDFEMCKQWQTGIIGKAHISEFQTEDPGKHWFVYLAGLPMEFTNLSDEDVKTFTGLDLSGLNKNSD